MPPSAESGPLVHSVSDDNEAMNKELLLDVIRWDTVNWGRSIRIWEGHLRSQRELVCLEVGAREGGLSLWAALSGNTAVCSDRDDPENTASPLHKKHGVEDKVRYEAINILDIPYESHFDIVFLKSVLPSVGKLGKDEQIASVKEMHKALKPGGKLLFAENLAASRVHSFARRKFTAWGDRLRYSSLDELEGFFADFSSLEYQALGFLGTFGRTESQRRLLGRLDSLLVPLVPRSWRYLAIGVAVK